MLTLMMLRKLSIFFLISLLLTALLSLVPIIIKDNIDLIPSLIYHKDIWSYFDSFKIGPFNEVYDYYQKHLRGNIFAGLISVGGFLMAGKTFILITMKQNVFDSPEYIKRHEDLRVLDPDLKLYDQLIELKDILYLSVLVTILAAIVQFTIGLIPHWSFSFLAITVSIFSIILVIDGLNYIKINLDFWLKSDD